MSAERERVAGFGRLEDGLRQAGDWYRWGPYVSERQWGTVREDYSPGGEAWDYLPHDHARSRAYRWGEDGLAGFCDIEQRLCLSLALWNGRDPILKERAFGLTGAQGNHGEDVKEYWWYLDAIPSHAWNRWRYHYPQAAFPYQELIDANAARNRLQPEYELLDTGVFDDGRYWIVEVAYAKADPDDLLMRISVTNPGPDTETLHVLPTSWFRNTWSWEPGTARPAMAATSDTSAGIEHPFLGPLELIAGPGPDGAAPTALFCENETNVARLFGAEPVTPYPKDGINDHVIHGAPTVNPERTGTKCAFWYQVMVPPGETAELRLRLRPATAKAASERTDATLGAGFGRVMAERRAEADEFYAELTPRTASADEAMVMRQAFAGLLGREGLADPGKLRERGLLRGQPGEQKLLLTLAGPDRLGRLLVKLFDESEFLSPHGLRAPSAYHRDHPYRLQVEGVTASIDYEPAESTTPMFGGNSNWRGPVWFPLNYLVISALDRYYLFYSGQFTIEYPTGSGRMMTLDQVAADLQDRLISIFTRGPDGRRPCFGGAGLLQTDPAWRDNLAFGEYFHGDNGAAIGAWHQTGWTGLIADIIRRRYGQVRSVSEIAKIVGQEARS